MPDDPSPDPDAAAGPPEEPRIPIPDGLDEGEREAFRMGFRMCAEMAQRATATWAQALDGDADGDGEDEDAPEDCPDCGAKLRQGLGDTRVCPDCS